MLKPKEMITQKAEIKISSFIQKKTSSREINKAISKPRVIDVHITVPA